MRKQLQEYTKEQLIEVIQDYQEMVGDIEGVLNTYRNYTKLGLREAIRFELDKERPGCRIYEDEKFFDVLDQTNLSEEEKKKWLK